MDWTVVGIMVSTSSCINLKIPIFISNPHLDKPLACMFKIFVFLCERDISEPYLIVVDITSC
jgi:hypothetical protein